MDNWRADCKSGDLHNSDRGIAVSGSIGSDSRSVYSAITSVSFPETLERVRAMGKKWLNLVAKDWITDMDVLLHFPKGKNVLWIAPKWLTEGDILFFYHTKTARAITTRLWRQTSPLKYSAELRHSASLGSELDAEMMIRVMGRAVSIADSYSGTLFGFAEVSGRPTRMFDELKHFKGTIYAPLRGVSILNYPLSLVEFADVLRIGQNTTTPIYGHAFEEIKRRIARRNELPELLRNTKPKGLGFREVTGSNWDTICCDKQTRFIDEEQIRTYWVDYLLRELKDAGSTVYEECTCFKGGQRSGRVDYMVKVGGRLIPVEAKLNVLAEQDISSQIVKYVHMDHFLPTKGYPQAIQIRADETPFCLIVDQAGIYLTKDGTFLDCSPDSPRFTRERMDRTTMPSIRNWVARFLSGFE